MNAYFLRKELRARFLAEQQTQLAKDAKLPDPAEAYRVLLDELDEDDDEWSKGGEQAA